MATDILSFSLFLIQLINIISLGVTSSIFKYYIFILKIVLAHVLFGNSREKNIIFRLMIK